MNEINRQQSESMEPVSTTGTPEPAAGQTGGIKQSVQESSDKIKTKASELASQAKQHGQDYLHQGKTTAADKIGSYGETLRRTTDRLEEEHDPNIAHYTRVIATKLEDAAAYIRHTEIRDLQRDASDLARRHPAVFCGAMFLAGMAAARFLKASADHQHTEGTLDESDQTQMEGTFGSEDYPVQAEQEVQSPGTSLTSDEVYPSHSTPVI